MKRLIPTHPSEGDLHAYHDQELSEDARSRLERHLADCVHCMRRLDGLRVEISQVQQELASLAPPPSTTPRPYSVDRARFESYVLEKEKAPMSRSLSTRMRWFSGILAVVTLFAAAFAFPQVRAIANDFLGLFRIEQIALIPFNADNQMAQQAGNNTGQWLDQNATYQEIGHRQDVTSPEEASAIVGFPVRLLTYENLGDPTLRVEPGIHSEFTVDLPRIRSILQEAGYTDISLPDNLDQAQIIVDVPQPVVAEYGDCRNRGSYDPDMPQRSLDEARCITLVQIVSPVINAPPDLNLQQLGKVFLQLSGMHSADAEAFSRNVDWATTMVIPIDRDSDYEEIEVDGVQGVLLRQRYNSNRYTVFWVKDGILYGLSGNNNSYNGRVIANSIR